MSPPCTTGPGTAATMRRFDPGSTRGTATESLTIIWYFKKKKSCHDNFNVLSFVYQG